MNSSIFSDFNYRQYFDKDINIDDIVEIKITNHTKGVKNIWFYMKFVDGTTKKNIHMDPCMTTSMNIYNGVYKHSNETDTKDIIEKCNSINKRILHNVGFILFLEHSCAVLTFHLADSNMSSSCEYKLHWHTHFEHDFCLKNHDKEINEDTVKIYVSENLQKTIFEYLGINDNDEKNINRVRSYIYHHMIIGNTAMEYIKNITR